MRNIIIGKNEAGQRFDKYLFKYFNEATSGFIYKMLRKKNIVLNDKKAAGNEILKENDDVKIYMSEDTINKFSKGVSFELVDSDIEIIYEDDNVIMVNKPAGVLSQKAEKDDVSINEMIISYLIKSGQLSIEDLNTFKPSICNRLDRNTSGLIVAGKSMIGLQEFSKYFKNRMMNKIYITVVLGKVENEDLIKGYLVKDEKINKVEVLDYEIEGASYIETKYKPIKVTDDYTILEVELITGKTHQIRAHLASIGNPIVGEAKYNDGLQNEQMSKLEKKYDVKRQLLHSYKLMFEDLDEVLDEYKNREFVSEIPDDIKKFY